MRGKPAVAAAYAVLAAALSAGILLPAEGAGWSWSPSFNLRLFTIAVLALIAAAIPLFREGFKELFREAMSRNLRRVWKQALLAALFQVALLVAPFVLLVGLSGRVSPLPLNQTKATVPPSTGSQGQESPVGGPGMDAGARPPTAASSGQTGAVEQNGSSFPMLVVMGAILAIAAATAFYAAYEAWAELRASRARGGEPARGEAELLEATQRAIREVERGVDPRGAIVSYFLRLCWLLQEQGVKVSEEMTAREIALAALNSFPRLNPVPLARLVSLFEEARYSDHRVDEAMRREALACFTAIRDSLAGVRIER